MGKPRSRSEILVLAGLAVALLLPWVLVSKFVLGHSYSLYDDAYIYLRYARNLVHGCGFRFNCADPPVEGFSSPLYLLLLAGGGLASADLETWTQLLSAATLAAALSVTAATACHASLGRGRSPAGIGVAVAAAAVLGFDHFILLNSVIGMESALCALFVAVIFRVALSERQTGLRALLVASVLVRPECVLFIATLPLLPRARTLRYLAPIAAALVAITALRWLIFDDVLPNTYWAKAGGTAGHARLGLRYLVQLCRDFPIILAAPLALLTPGSRRVTTWLLVTSALWCAFFLRTGGDTFLYSRLAMPLVPTLTLLALHGIWTAAERLLARRARLVWLAPVVTLTLAALLSLRSAHAHELADGHGFDNVQRWKIVGKWLAQNAPGRRIATVPIGAISYFSDLRVLDLVGLTAPAIAHAGRSVPPELLGPQWIGHERHNTEWVLAQKPDLIVMTEWQGQPYDLASAKAGFYAEWLLLRAIKEGRAPYAVCDAEIAPHIHWLMFCRR